MSILSDEILESLICTQCKKYLSVKPVKVYHNRGIKCGRCSGPSDGGVNSLYGILAEDVLFRCVNRFEGCSQLLAYGDVVEHEKICNATRKYDCPVCTNPFEATGYELLIHFKENHPDRLLIGKAEFVLTIDYEESRTYLYRKNDLLFFIISNYDKNIKELTLNAKYLGASQEAAIIFQKFGLLSVDEKVVSKTRQKPCSSEQTLDNFKIALNEECFPKQVVLCKLELVTGPAEQIWVLPKSTSHKELQIEQLNLRLSNHGKKCEELSEEIAKKDLVILDVGKDRDYFEKKSRELIEQIGQMNLILCNQGKKCEELSEEIAKKNLEILDVRKDRDYFARKYRELNKKLEKEQAKGDMKVKQLKELNERINPNHEIVPEQREVGSKELKGKMGKEISNGVWGADDRASFVFTIDGRHYIYGVRYAHCGWLIREILPTGQIGRIISKGEWKWQEAYATVFPLFFNGRQFFLQHCILFRGDNFFIREILPGGIMGEETDHADWKVGYNIFSTFTINGRYYFFAHSNQTLEWFIQELLPDGRLGEKTSQGKWAGSYDGVFPYSINGRHFLYSHRTKGQYWVIYELLPGGKIGGKISDGQRNLTNLHVKNEVCFPFGSGGRHYFYSQIRLPTPTEKNWFIQELLPNGKMGEETDSGCGKNYKVGFPFCMNGKQLFYGQIYDFTKKKQTWFIKLLL